MTSAMAPGTFIGALGEELVECDWSCEGICNDPSRGVLPRCMFLENETSDERGCIVVGLNPGRAPEVERDYYLSNGRTYQSTVNFWNERSARIPYYARLRGFSELLGLAGPILWTELAKCESAADGPTMPAIQTLRRCAGRYLDREIEAMPPDWPVLAIGQDAFRALAFMSPQRIVVGIPHPTGSRGHFSGLVSSLRDGGSGLAATRAILNRAEPTATWLQVSDNRVNTDKAPGEVVSD